jgi:hypothetical protein
MTTIIGPWALDAKATIDLPSGEKLHEFRLANGSDVTWVTVPPLSLVTNGKPLRPKRTRVPSSE